MMPVYELKGHFVVGLWIRTLTLLQGLNQQRRKGKISAHQRVWDQLSHTLLV